MISEEKGRKHSVLTAAGIILCLILLPVLIINSTLLVKSFKDKNNVPDFGGYMPMIVLSDSMLPEIKAGDMVICKVADAEDIAVGDVISFYDPAGNGTSVVTHRVAEISEQDGKKVFRTKGDNNNTEDQFPVSAEKLVGRYTGIKLAGLGNAAMFMQTTTGLFVCVIVPLLLLIGYDLIRRSSIERKQKADTEALLAELEQLRSQQKKGA